MDRSTPDRTIVEAIIRMAAGLQIDVVAEGVETIEQARGLVYLGCAHAQGYYYARPMPSTDVAVRLDHGLPHELCPSAPAGPPRLKTR